MSELGDFLSDSVPFDVNGITYQFAKIDLGMMADFDTMMAARRLKTALNALGDDARPGERAELIRDMAGGSGRASAAEMETVSGIRLMLYLSLKRNHPDVTEDAVGRMITLKRFDEFKALLEALSEVEETEADSKNAETMGVEAGLSSS
jgi:hypothetical protein